tara:strand:+ start:946 stop:1671 length:726 start_codon:yes stop_codon:yes gene_type:complete
MVVKILITRPEPDASDLTIKLISKGYKVLKSPIVDIIEYKNNLTDLDNISAVITSSKNGIRSLARANKNRNICLYVVGQASKEEAERIGYTNIRVGPGDAIGLCDLICDKLSPSHDDLIYISGRHQSFDISGYLISKKFNIKKVVLYEVKAKKDFPKKIIEAIKNNEIDALLFYSPRVAEIFVEFIQEKNLANQVKNFDVFCISAKVAKKIENVGWRRVLIANYPDQKSIFSLLDSVASIG